MDKKEYIKGAKCPQCDNKISLIEDDDQNMYICEFCGYISINEY